jgi:cytochrome c oxidase subunit IV
MQHSHGHTNDHTHGTHTDAAHGDAHTFDTKAIWRTFWILLIITCIELVVGMFIAPRFHHTTKVWFNILYIIFTGAKAFYIIAEFMHLRHEIKNMVMTIAVPALLFIWFIGAFLWDGDSFKNLRNKLDRYQQETHKEQPTQPIHGEDQLK